MKSMLTIFLIFSISLVCLSQDICTGNLGENIFAAGDFGSGMAPVLANDPGIAPGYNYTTNVPNDGFYTICNNTGALPGLYPTWLAVMDNSDDPNGYMMVVNASFSPGIFYEEEVSGLCENTLYEFSADIINLIRAGTSNHSDPNVSFLIDGVMVYNTGDIPKTERWKQFGFSFVTTSAQSTITLTLRNNAPGGIGNDLALDNISFRPCGPSSFIGIESDTTVFLCVDDEPLTVMADIETAEGQVFTIQWQSSSNGTDWTTLQDSTNNTIIHSDFTPGDYYYRYYSAGNEINILNDKCRIISDIIKLTILPDTYLVSDTICEGETYAFGSQMLEVAGEYIERFESQYECDSTVFLDLHFISPQEILFEDIHIADPSCFGFDDGFIQINSIQGGNGELTFGVFLGSEEILGTSLFAGDYEIVVKDKYGCTESLIIELMDPPENEVFIGVDTTVRLGDGLMLSPEYSTDFESISWSGTGEFSCQNCEQPTYVPFYSGDIQVVVSDEDGCRADHSIRVNVDEENVIVFPNVFSPNEDNINDFFTLYYYGRSVGKVLSFSVYDRWGGLIHSVRNSVPESGGVLWDGYSGAVKVAQGVYLYSVDIQLINGDIISRIGNITVLK